MSNRDGYFAMTLKKRITLGMFVVSLLVFFTAVTIIFCIERYYYREQSHRASHNVAISLSQSLARPLAQKNTKALTTIIDSVFNRGAFDLLQVRDSTGAVIVSRHNILQQRVAPVWFTNVIHWTTIVSSVPVMSSQTLVGELEVRSDPRYAWNAMWNSFVVLVYWYLFWLVVSLIAYLLVVPWLLKPIQRVIKQANALRQRKFLIEPEIPETAEFKAVAVAMNELVLDIKTLVQSQLEHMELLRYRLFRDKLTGLGNERYFHYQLMNLIYEKDNVVPGFILCVSIDEFSGQPLNYSDSQAIRLIKNIASLCTEFDFSYPDLIVARTEPGRFMLIIKENDEQLLIERCEILNQKIQKLTSKPSNWQVLMAVVSYQNYKDSALLLGEIGQTVTQAKNEPNQLAISANLATHRQTVIELEALEEILDQGLAYLDAEPVSDGQLILHQELTIKIPVDESLMNSQYIAPMARESGLARQFDAYILEQVCEEELLGSQPMAFSLSELALADERTLQGCVTTFTRLSTTHLSRLRFEVEELLAVKYLAQLIPFCNALADLGVGLGVTQAGIHYSTMTYLNELPLNYLKLHGSLSHEIDEDKTFIIHYLLDIATNFNMDIIATEVENRTEWHNLSSLGVQWGQGDYFNELRLRTELM